MSPNVGNFVHDLVEMAKATERLPELEQELSIAKSNLDKAQEHNAGLEQNIIGYKQQIEELNAKVRSLEVERDDASFRVLEAEDREHVALNMARSIASAVGNVINTLDPPKPEPEPQAQPVATPAEGQSEVNPTASTDTQSPNVSSETVSSQEGASISELPGQSESSPTVNTGTTQVSAGQTPATNSDVGLTSEESGVVDPGPALGPYFGKHYHTMPQYIPYQDWIAGRGTDEDYYFRPDFNKG